MCWIVYVASESDALAWIAFALPAIVATLGFTMLAVRTRQRHRSAWSACRDTVVLVLLTAVGVGD